MEEDPYKAPVEGAAEGLISPRTTVTVSVTPASNLRKIVRNVALLGCLVWIGGAIIAVISTIFRIVGSLE